MSPVSLGKYHLPFFKDLTQGVPDKCTYISINDYEIVLIKIIYTVLYTLGMWKASKDIEIQALFKYSNNVETKVVRNKIIPVNTEYFW